jgi:hypothetical protein
MDQVATGTITIVGNDTLGWEGGKLRRDCLALLGLRFSSRVVHVVVRFQEIEINSKVQFSCNF